MKRKNERKDLIGKEFSHLKVIGLATKSKRQGWLMTRCKCGKRKKIKRFSLLSGESKSCGCMNGRWHERKIIGRRFGRLEVIKFSHKIGKQKFYKTRCDCGKTPVKCGRSMRRGNTKSCGCLKREGVAKRAWKHGMHNSSLYGIWSAMKQRCYNKNNIAYKNYGGRKDHKITVCPKWRKSFSAFYADVGDRPSLNHQLDRKKNDRGYYPKNVRWVLRRVNLCNKRTNRIITFKRKTMTATEWSRICGVSASAIVYRMDKLNLSAKDALTIPPDGLKSRTVLKQIQEQSISRA